MLADRRWPQIARGATLVVPVGALEQHGPHLPLDTDAVIAAAVAEQLGERWGAEVAPVVAYGASGEHQSFPGTLSIGTSALATVLVELARSATTWADRVVFVNGHGGNLPALRRAVELLVAEGRDVGWLPCAPRGGAGDAHAGRDETSMMLHLAPERVRVDAAEAGATEPLADLMPAMVAGGVAAVSANGVLGDPAGATAEEGARLLGSIVADADQRVAG